MVKQCPFVALLAAVALLPVGAAQGRSDLDSAPPFIILDVTGKLGANGWHVENTRVAWSYGPGPEIDTTVGCDTKTVRVGDQGNSLHLHRDEQGGSNGLDHICREARQDGAHSHRPAEQAGGQERLVQPPRRLHSRGRGRHLRVGRLQLGPVLPRSEQALR